MKNLAKMIIFYHSLLILISGTLIEATFFNRRAHHDCSKLHQADVELNGTAYSENGCLLTCNFRGRFYQHTMHSSLSNWPFP